MGRGGSNWHRSRLIGVDESGREGWALWLSVSGLGSDGNGVGVGCSRCGWLVTWMGWVGRWYGC